MIKRIEYIYFLLVGLIFIGCEEKIDWKFPDQESGNLVVESIITDEYKKHEILLSLSQASMGDASMAAIDADINLIGSNDIYTFTESQSFPGSYESDKSFAAKLNINYQLEINWNNEKLPVLIYKRISGSWVIFIRNWMKIFCWTPFSAM